jgi:hypothetical protein
MLATPDDPAPTGPLPPAAPPLSDEAATRDLLYHSLLRGLCVAIPLPFVDDWAIERVRRRAVRRVFAAHGLVVAVTERDTVLHGPAGPAGCWRGCLLAPLPVLCKLLLWPVRRILGLVLFVFTLRQMVTQATAQFQEGAALSTLLDDTDLHAAFAAEAAATAALIHRSVRRTCATADSESLRGLFSHSLGGARQVMRTAGAAFRAQMRRLWRRRKAADETVDAAAADAEVGEGIAASTPGFDALLASLTNTLKVHPEYLDRLRTAARAALATERSALASERSALASERAAPAVEGAAK